MPTYVYETIPSQPGHAPRRFELKQSMKDEPLKHDPETGLPVKRVISGGFAPLTAGSGDAPAATMPRPSSHSCGSMCGCARN
jgi:predicted nucleic acid-binding Zn ribbon protein